MPFQKHQYPNFYAYRLMVNGNECAWEDKRRFIQNINTLFRGPQRVVYRGESWHSLTEVYGTEMGQLFNELFFGIGPKGRAFMADRDQTHNLNDISIDFFSELFHWIHDFLNMQGIPRPLYFNIQSFSRRNPEFAAFFGATSNAEAFLKKMRQIKTKKQKIEIRDYYLKLLHHSDRNYFYGDSYFLSLSASWSIAKGFSGNRNNVPTHDELIIMGWVPNKDAENLIVRSFSNSRKTITYEVPSIIHENQFLTYTPLFPKQKEANLKGGLLPDYMVGYYLNAPEGEEFHINPAFLQAEDQWMEEGLEIDRGQFYQQIAQTRFNRVYHRYPDGLYSDEFLG